jgi:hypothetical protein
MYLEDWGLQREEAHAAIEGVGVLHRHGRRRRRRALRPHARRRRRTGGGLLLLDASASGIRRSSSSGDAYGDVTGSWSLPLRLSCFRCKNLKALVDGHFVLAIPILRPRHPWPPSLSLVVSDLCVGRKTRASGFEVGGGVDGALNAGASSQAGGEEGARAAVSHVACACTCACSCSCLQLNRKILEASNSTQSRAAPKQATNSLISRHAWKGTSNSGPLFTIVQPLKITGHQRIAVTILALVVATTNELQPPTVSAGRSDPRQRRRGEVRPYGR